MKFFALILPLLFISTTTFAQQKSKKGSTPVVTMTPQEAMDKYDFAKAETLIEQEITKLQKKGQSTEEQEKLLDLARARRIKLQATEQVTIIDSIVTRKNLILDFIKLSDESGSISCLTDKKDTLQRIVYQNQLGNRKILADTDKSAHLKLFEQIMEGGNWSQNQLCKGLSEEQTDNLNFPFMLNDGATLYYAAQSDESIGGYDIFMTRYDSDEKTFLSPENVGMPFNSPANDYLMVIDEFYNIGYFVSDRNQPADSVCIYVFVPSETRKVYSEEEVGEQKLRNLAQINSIKDTWTNKDLVSQAQQRYTQLKKGNAIAEKKHDFDFVINDSRTYTTLTDFKNKNAVLKANFWLENSRDIAKTEKELSSLRQQYQSGKNDNKQQIAPQIRLLESNLEKMYSERKTLEKEIRKLELGQ